MGASNPLLNGYKHSFASIELNIAGKRYNGFTTLNYSDDVERSDVRGNHAIRRGRTKGQYSCEGSITIESEEHETLLADLGDGFYDAGFDITATYADDSAPTITDKLIGCQFAGTGRSNSEGSDGLGVELDLDITYIMWNGKKPFRRMPEATSKPAGPNRGR